MYYLHTHNTGWEEARDKELEISVLWMAEHLIEVIIMYIYSSYKKIAGQISPLIPFYLGLNQPQVLVGIIQSEAMFSPLCREEWQP